MAPGNRRLFLDKQKNMKQLINWLEIPVSDMPRAIAFYKQILGIDFYEMEMGDVKYALFPSEDRFNNGALAHGPYYQPSAVGITIYLDGGDDLSKILKKVSAAGGNVLMEKTLLSKETGYVGLFSDSEGNRIGLQHM
jgi:predicted enzyme related to lactoylglutathione lyase